MLQSRLPSEMLWPHSRQAAANVSQEVSGSGDFAYFALESDTGSDGDGMQLHSCNDAFVNKELLRARAMSTCAAQIEQVDYEHSCHSPRWSQH